MRCTKEREGGGGDQNKSQQPLRKRDVNVDADVVVQEGAACTAVPPKL